MKRCLVCVATHGEDILLALCKKMYNAMTNRTLAVCNALVAMCNLVCSGAAAAAIYVARRLRCKKFRAPKVSFCCSHIPARAF